MFGALLRLISGDDERVFRTRDEFLKCVEKGLQRMKEHRAFSDLKIYREDGKLIATRMYECYTGLRDEEVWGVYVFLYEECEEVYRMGTEMGYRNKLMKLQTDKDSIKFWFKERLWPAYLLLSPFSWKEVEDVEEIRKILFIISSSSLPPNFKRGSLNLLRNLMYENTRFKLY